MTLVDKIKIYFEALGEELCELFSNKNGNYHNM